MILKRFVIAAVQKHIHNSRTYAVFVVIVLQIAPLGENVPCGIITKAFPFGRCNAALKKSLQLYIFFRNRNTNGVGGAVKHSYYLGGLAV